VRAALVRLRHALDLGDQAEARAFPELLELLASSDPDPSLIERMLNADRTPGTLEIEGERVVLVSPEGQRHELELAALIEKSAPGLPPDLVWPRGVCAVRAGHGGFTLAFEIPPSVRRLRWGVRPEARDRRFAYRDVRLALPYVVFVTGVRFDSSGTFYFDGWAEAYFANEPVSSATKPLHLAPLLNVVGRGDAHSTGGAVVCMGGFGHRSTSADGDPSERLHRGLAAIVGHFLDSGWNEDFERTGRVSAFNDPRSKPADPRLATVEAWEEASAKDPRFVLEIPWVPTPRTLSRALESVATHLAIAGRVTSWNQHLQRLILRHGSRADAAAASAGPPAPPSSGSPSP
jgi:hypothetical protein